MKLLIKSNKPIYAASASRLWTHLMDDNMSFAIIGCQDKDTKEIRKDELYQLVSDYNNEHKQGYNKAFGRYTYDDGTVGDEPSVIIYNISKNDALDIANALNQESIVYKGPEFFGILNADGSIDMEFVEPGFSFNALDEDEKTKLAEQFGTMIADKGSWNQNNPAGKKPRFVFSAYLGRPSSWKRARIMSSSDERYATSYSKLFEVTSSRINNLKY